MIPLEAITNWGVAAGQEAEAIVINIDDGTIQGAYVTIDGITYYVEYDLGHPIQIYEE